jgi:hypothetical protein
MNAGNFDSHVTIRLPDTQRSLTISNASEAASVLADKWPVTYGRAYQRALAMCAAVAEGVMTAENARSAFIKAALEAGVSTENSGSSAILISPDKLAGTKPIAISRDEQSPWAMRAAGTGMPRQAF